MAVVSAIIVNGARNSLLPENGWVKDVSDLVEVACGHEPKTLKEVAPLACRGRFRLSVARPHHSSSPSDVGEVEEADQLRHDNQDLAALSLRLKEHTLVLLLPSGKGCRFGS
jgi:hypothetical protein